MVRNQVPASFYFGHINLFYFLFRTHARRYVVLPLLQHLPEAIFQQDKTRSHFANITLSLLTENNVNLLPGHQGHLI